MMLRAPNFWRANGRLAVFLSPLAMFYGAMSRRLLARSAPRAIAPTIIVGGLTIGGDGKTPLVIALVDLLQQSGERPVILTRGYGGDKAGRAPILVDLTRHDASRVGDEALLLARHAPTIVSRDRVSAAAVAQKLGASVLVLDDGFHSRRLAADLSILAIDANYLAGNGRCLPAGPLRAPLEDQLGLADACVMINASATPVQSTPPWLSSTVFHAQVFFEPSHRSAVSASRIVAFAAIARPEKFFNLLHDSGAHLVARRAYADHHIFSRSELLDLRELALRLNATLATTEKDAVRLENKQDVMVLPLRLVLSDPEAVTALMTQAIHSARLNRGLSL